MAFSGDGQMFAWCNGDALVLAKLDQTGVWNVRWKSEEARRTVYIAFSPKNTFLATWEVNNLVLQKENRNYLSFLAGLVTLLIFAWYAYSL